MKLAFVAPRYGAEITGGPEHACRLLAEHASDRHEVEVLTTCAADSSTWHNRYGEGTDRVRGVLVRRFPVNQPHDAHAFRRLSERLFRIPHGRADEREWVRRLGPMSPALVDHLRRHHRSYDAVAFFSMYHATTVFGVEVAPERTILFPCLQLGPALRFGIWGSVFRSAHAVGYLSVAERALGRAFCEATPVGEETVGIGVDLPAQQTYPRHQQDPTDEATGEDDAHESEPSDGPSDYLASRGVLFRRRHRLYGSFVLYGGRVRPDNGCEEMLEYFAGYAAHDGDTALVLMGAKLINVAEHPHVRLAGVLPERERMVAYEAADVTLAPEPDDLLATAVLESFAAGTPVLASARNTAAVDHCRRANAGLYYANRDEFTTTLRLLMTDARLRVRLGENGRRYVRQNHRWDAVVGRFERLVMKVRQR